MSRLIRLTVLPMPRKASSRNPGSSKCTGRLVNMRLSVEAAFLRSWTKKADTVWNASLSLPCRHLSGQTQIEQTGTDLATDAFEQVEFLDRVAEAVNAIGQDRDAEAAIVGSQRQANSMTALSKFAGADFSQLSAHSPLDASRSNGWINFCNLSKPGPTEPDPSEESFALSAHPTWKRQEQADRSGNPPATWKLTKR